MNKIKLQSSEEKLGGAAQWALDHILEKKRKTLFYSQFLESGVLAFASILDEYDIPYVKITGKETKDQRAKAVERFNTDPTILVFLISKAGGEGLDLKGVRDVILFESSWNPATEEQVIARADRYKSHADLPISQRNVSVYRLLLVKPPEAEAWDELPSVDSYLYNLAQEKGIKIKGYMKILAKGSIENNPTC